MSGIVFANNKTKQFFPWVIKGSHSISLVIGLASLLHVAFSKFENPFFHILCTVAKIHRIVLKR